LAEKIRVYKLAKELGVSSREILWALEQLDVKVKNHMSTITMDLINPVRRELRIPVEEPEPEAKEEKAQEAEEPPSTKPRAQVRPGREPAPSEEAAPAPGRAARAEITPDEPAPQEPERPEPQKPPARERVTSEREERYRARRARRRRSLEARRQEVLAKEIVVEGPMTVGNLARKLRVKPTDVIKRLMGLGVMAGLNQEVEPDVIQTVASDLGFEVEMVEAEPSPEEQLLREEEDAPESLAPRWPVVTVMGHVDHGKTSLLDAIRRTRVTESEAGGITQHIGASTVRVGDKRIVFVDTPGHEAFTAMRARGAQVTDIAVLVVAADDGVMPQTIEAINHARAAGVPIIVAINKVDLPNANVDRVKQQLAEQGLTPEDWGGDTVCVEVSAREKRNLDDLLDMITLVAEMQELRANPEKRARGTIIESELSKGRGPVATAIIQSGALEVGDAFVAGACYGKVRAMFDDRGRRVKKAGPASAVEILGFSDVPAAGDILIAVPDDRTARQIAQSRAERRRRHEMEASGRARLQSVFEKLQRGETAELGIVLKADVQGSVDALRQAIDRLDTDEVHISVVHAGVGAVSESDVMLAAASGAMVVGFAVRPDPQARRVAEAEGVEVRTYDVIYDAIDDLRAAAKGLLKPVEKEVVLGRAEVRATFRVPKVGVVAGCYVTEGKVVRNAAARLLRDGAVVHSSRIASLKRYKDDVREVQHGYECGIGLEGFDDVKEGDEIEAFEIVTVER